MDAVARRIVVVICAVALVGCRPLSSHPLAVAAVQEVKRNPRVAEVLGPGVLCGGRVSGTVNETDGIAALAFDIIGPKGKGMVAVEGKKTGGVWGVTHLELQPERGGPLALTADIETDTPKFDPSAAPARPATTIAPPGDVEITLPPGAPGG